MKRPKNIIRFFYMEDMPENVKKNQEKKYKT